MGLSALKSQRNDYHLILDSRCDKCGAPKEDTVHYFQDCPGYSAIRKTLKDEVEPLLFPLGITVNTENSDEKNDLTYIYLHGSELLTLQSNISIMNSVQKYITSSKRF